jgi:hypothetical protein
VPPHCGRARTLRSRAHSRRIGTERLAGFTPTDLVARVGATPRWCRGHDRPSQEEGARALGRGLLLTTHFSGADEGRLEPYGNTLVGLVIVNQGKVVRPSQLIASVRQTCGRA